jgi:DNA-binding NtrC family response regulator
MTTVLIVDADDDSRFALEAQLAESNQFERVLSCAGLEEAIGLIRLHCVKVVLVDANEASRSATLQRIKSVDPDMGVVLIQGDSGILSQATLRELGAHAQASRVDTTMDIIASVAKALVTRLRPGGRLLGKFLKDSK